MKSFSDNAIILKRTDYGEADKIITFLTAEHGQLQAIAKGVKRSKSKLAGGLELFSITSLSVIEPKAGVRSGLSIVRSARIHTYFSHILEDYNRVEFAYAAIAALHTMTADQDEPAGYTILAKTFQMLDNLAVPLPVVQLWFYLVCLQILGQQPNLEHDVQGAALDRGAQYSFTPSLAGLVLQDNGPIGANEIKTLRLLNKSTPDVSLRVAGLAESAQRLEPVFGDFFRRILVLGG